MKQSDILVFIFGMLACLAMGVYFGIASAQAFSAQACIEKGKWQTTARLVSDKPIVFLCRKEQP